MLVVVADRMGFLTPDALRIRDSPCSGPIASLARPAWFGFVLLALSTDGAQAQIVTEFSAGITARSYPSDIKAGSDGNLWFTEPGSGRIGRITALGVVTEFSAGITAAPLSITAGPDGNLWFTEHFRIGRITPLGVVTEFSTGIVVSAGPQGITTGPDGNLWFTEGRNGIGRITPLGVVTEFSTGATLVEPIGIAVGSDGNLWFADNVGSRIGRMTPLGVVTLFSAGISFSASPAGITAGPDGNLWFPEANGDRIGRMTTLGVVTEFSVIPYDSGTIGIAAGPDGNLWFAESSRNRIGRMTPFGVVNEFSAGISVGARPQGITAGPDGNVWFTEPGGNRIARITTHGGTCAPSATNLCLTSARFKVEATWTGTDGTSGSGEAVALSPDSGYFWFFLPSNVEIAVKVLNGCSFSYPDYWIFAAGMTNVNVVLTITDTETGQVKTYTNPQNTAFQPIQDARTFSTCP